MLLRFSIFSFMQTNWGNLAIINALHPGRNLTMAHSPDTATPYLQGLANYRAGNFSEARRHFQESLSTHLDLARNFMLESALAEGDWEKILKTIDISRLAERIFLVKVLVEHEDRIDTKTQKQYMDMIQADPSLASAYLHLLLSKNLFDEVIEFGAALPHDGEFVQVRFMMGRAYFYKKDYASAAKIFEKIHEQQPTLDNAVWLGKALFNSGRPEEGLRYLETILQQPSGRRYIPYLVDLSVAYAAVGRCIEAKQTFSEAVKTDRTGSQHALLESAQRTITGQCQK
ncbi:MAG: tetratricopeptide repeat protein [Anaerolineales bacterium]|nr:tetratricopeptide repeat protein [Anaerolineales bacterium]